jgi:hypothetical protein
VIQKLFTVNTTPKLLLGWKLCAQQRVVWIRIYRILYDEMEILAVNCQLDVILGPSGGVLRRWRLPLCDVSLSQTYQNNRHPVVGGNYARSSWVFESGFTEFSRLTITTLVWIGRLLLNGAFIAKPLADVLHIGEK